MQTQNGKYVYIIRSIYFSYYCLIDDCCADYAFPTNSKQAMEHVKRAHKKVYAIVIAEEKEKEAKAATSNMKSEQRKLTDYSKEPYDRHHPK